MCVFNRELLFLKAAGEAACSSFTLNNEEFQGTSSNYIHSFKVQESWLSTAYLTLSGPKRSLSLKQYVKCAGVIFLHERLICHSTQLTRGTSLLFPNTNEESRGAHVGSGFPESLSQSAHALCGRGAKSVLWEGSQSTSL